MSMTRNANSRALHEAFNAPSLRSFFREPPRNVRSRECVSRAGEIGERKELHHDAYTDACGHYRTGGRRSSCDGDGPELDELMRARDVVGRQDGLHEDPL